jgi:plastocyanin
MHNRRKILAGTFAVGLIGVTLSACGSDTAPPATGAKSAAAKVVEAPKGPATATVDIPGEDRFSPFLTMVAPMGVITIVNHDTDAHTVTSLPGASVPFNLDIEGNGGTKTLQLPAGVYHYYCTAHAKYDEKTGEVEALPSAGFPDEPMEGVFIVG